MKTHNRSASNQRGAVLVVSLILLLLMTILAVSMSQTTTLNERMAGNARDSAAALQAADAGIPDAEEMIRRASEPELMAFGDEECGVGVKSRTVCPAGRSALNDASLEQTDLVGKPDAWWNSNDNAYKFGTDATQELDSNYSDPTYFTQKIAHIQPDSLTNEGGQPLLFIEVTSRAHGKTGQSEAIVQSVYARAVSK